MHNGKMYIHILPVPLLVNYINLNISLMHVEHMEIMVYNFYLNFLYCQNAIWFCGTCISVILFSLIREIWPSLCRYL